MPCSDVGGFDWVHHGIVQSLQETAGILPQLGYEWFLNLYWSNVELKSRSPFHSTRFIVELKSVRHFAAVCVVFSPTPVIQQHLLNCEY